MRPYNIFGGFLALLNSYNRIFNFALHEAENNFLPLYKPDPPLVSVNNNSEIYITFDPDFCFTNDIWARKMNDALNEFMDEFMYRPADKKTLNILNSKISDLQNEAWMKGEFIFQPAKENN